MGKNQHSKDRLFITATEWSTQYGGKKKVSSGSDYRPLPFDHCALSLSLFEVPVMLSNNTGVVFDKENISQYLKKYGCDPVTGDTMSEKDIITLNMAKNLEGQWECPVTNKVFTPSSHIVIIKNTGNVYSFNAVDELNIKAKSYIDLIDGTPFKKSDIITLQDPTNPEIMKKRDINTFKHLDQVRADSKDTRKIEPKLRHTSASESVMLEIERVKNQEEEAGIKRKTTQEILKGSNEVYSDDVLRFLRLKPLISDVNPGEFRTDGRASISLTSTSTTTSSNNQASLATPNDIREARWKIMRKIGKPAYVQLQTNFGNLNIEIFAHMAMRTSWNFIQLCKSDYYNGTKFHRLVPSFIVQGGDPTGTGRGGESAFKSKFKDEFDTRLKHDGRGVVSMANSGANTNGSQFFFTFQEAKHLDLKHSVFGKIVGGLSILDKIEQIETDSQDKPVEPIEILNTVVFSDPIEEADDELEAFIKKNIEKRLSKEASTSLPKKHARENDEDAIKSNKQIKLS